MYRYMSWKSSFGKISPHCQVTVRVKQKECRKTKEKKAQFLWFDKNIWSLNEDTEQNVGSIFSWSLQLQISSLRLIRFDCFKQRLEISGTKTLKTTRVLTMSILWNSHWVGPVERLPRQRPIEHFYWGRGTVFGRDVAWPFVPCFEIGLHKCMQSDKHTMRFLFFAHVCKLWFCTHRDPFDAVVSGDERNLQCGCGAE